MSFIGRSWRGEERLWKVFWLYGFLLGICIQIVFAVLSIALAHASPSLAGFGSIPIGIFSLVYYIWLYISMWRCAFNADWTIFSYIVRLFVGIGAVGIFAAIIVIIGLIVTGHSRYFTYAIECNQQIEDTAMVSLKNGTSFGKEEQSDMFKKCMNSKIEKDEASQSGIIAPTKEKPSWDAYYLDACKQNMTDYARKNNIDPQQYIDENQVWLQDCVQAYKKENAAGSKKAP